MHQVSSVRDARYLCLWIIPQDPNRIWIIGVKDLFGLLVLWSAQRRFDPLRVDIGQEFPSCRSFILCHLCPRIHVLCVYVNHIPRRVVYMCEDQLVRTVNKQTGLYISVGETRFCLSLNAPRTR